MAVRAEARPAGREPIPALIGRRLDALARRTPTGRYVYESSSDEAPSPTLRPTDFGSDEESEGDAADLSAIRLANEVDPWERWDAACQRRAWIRLGHEPLRTDRVTPSRQDTPSASTVDNVAELLSVFQLQQKESERIEREAFEQRNASLWDGIEQAIRNAEKQAADHEEQLASARRKQEQAEADARQAREAELARIEQEKKAAEEEKARATAKQAELAELAQKEGAHNALRGGDRIWPGAKAELAGWEARMKQIKDEILPAVAANPTWRKQCFAAKRVITPKVGQLTNQREDIARITAAMHQVLDEARHAPDAEAQRFLYYWILNHLAKGLIRQAEQEVAARQETAYPLARLVMGLMLLGHDTLGEVFMARLVKKCPWVLGCLPERDGAERAYRKRLGFCVDADETTQMYTTRMAGISALYFACLQTPLDSVASCTGLAPQVTLAQAVESIPDAFRPSRLWTWQVRCTTPPQTRQPLVLALWSTFLEMAGTACLHRYQRQASKLWTMVIEQGIGGGLLGAEESAESNGQHDAQRAARVRLRLLLESWKQTGTLEGHATPGRDMDS